MAAAKKKAAILQVDITTDEDFKEFLGKEGLKIIDAYTAWCGPCKAMENTMRKAKNEIADPLLHFATVNTDTVSYVKEYNGTSEPIFLFYGADTLAYVQRGADGPALRQAIEDQLAAEKRALENGEERQLYIEPERTFEAEEEEEAEETPASRRASEAANREKQHKQYTFAMLKPDVADGDNVDEIFTMIAEAGLKVVKQDDAFLTSEMASAFYAEHEGKPFFDGLIEFMTSGPIKTIILTGENPVAQWRELLGPTNAETAREEAPDSIRARFGTDNTKNAAHGSDSRMSAHREIEFYFPDWAHEHLPVDECIACIVGDAIEAKDEILQDIKAAGFVVENQHEPAKMSEEDATLFAGENSPLIAALTENESVAVLVSRINAVTKLRELSACHLSVAQAKEKHPDSLFAKFGKVPEEDGATEVPPIAISRDIHTAVEDVQRLFPIDTSEAAEAAEQEEAEKLEKIAEEERKEAEEEEKEAAEQDGEAIQGEDGETATGDEDKKQAGAEATEGEGDAAAAAGGEAEPGDKEEAKEGATEDTDAPPAAAAGAEAEAEADNADTTQAKAEDGAETEQHETAPSSEENDKVEASENDKSKDESEANGADESPEAAAAEAAAES